MRYPALVTTTTERVALPLSGGKLRLVVVADTHSAPHARSAALVAEQRPDRILHAGDIGDRSVVVDLAKVAPTLAVRGNIDDLELPDELVVDVCGDDGASLTRILLLHIAVNGPRLRADAARRARAEDAALVICGHSHVPFLGQDGPFVIFNPGSIGPRRFDLPIVFGVIDISRSGVELHHVDCESGRRWVPKRPV